MIRIMKRSKILAAVLLLAMFSSLFAVGTVTLPAQTGSASAPTESELFTPDVMGDPMGDKGILAEDATAYTLVADGDLAEWEGLSFEVFGGVNVSLVYDATYVYVALQWKDSTEDVTVGQWNKTGMINAALVDWQFVDGADDVIQIGFSTGPYANNDSDMMIWTTSPRTNAGFAFECNATGDVDAGTNPYVMNTNKTTDTFVDAKPLYESDLSTLISDEFALANGTMYDAWLNSTTVAAGGQTDTVVSSDWNNTLMDYYTVEMIRLLDTGDADDFILDFADDLIFYVGSANQDDTFDMLISTMALNVALTNDAAALTFTTIVGDPVNEALVITGGVFDDFVGYDLIVEMDGWDDTYGAGQYFNVGVNEATGNYSFLFFFDEWDMPLGEQTIFVTLYPKYEAPIQLNQTIEIDDTKAPNIEGIVDLVDRYPDGVPLDEDYVVVTIGLADDYCVVDDITACLFSYVGDGTNLKIDMVQFAPGSTTFIANITIDHAIGVVNNYTYFVQAWDTSLNKVTSDYYWFLAASVAPIPAFGIIAGLFGLAASVFIIKKVKK